MMEFKVYGSQAFIDRYKHTIDNFCRIRKFTPVYIVEEKKE